MNRGFFLCHDHWLLLHYYYCSTITAFSRHEILMIEDRDPCEDALCAKKNGETFIYFLGYCSYTIVECLLGDVILDLGLGIIFAVSMDSLLNISSA